MKRAKTDIERRKSLYLINRKCAQYQTNAQNSVLMHAVGSRTKPGGAGRSGEEGGHSLQSCEKSLVGGKWKVGEEGLVTMAGAELMPLDTTEDAGT